MQNFGLKEKTEDKRDIHVGMITSLPALSTLPLWKKIPIPDEWKLTQTEDTCAGHATHIASSEQEQVNLDPIFTWVMARYYSKMTPDEWGIELRDMMMAHQKIGAIEFEQTPIREGDEGWRDPTNWTIQELLKKSVYHKKGSVVFIEPVQGYDYFDTIRALLVKYDTPIVIGIRWPYGTETDITEWKDGGYGHALAVIGYGKKIIDNVLSEYLIVCNSWGRNVGDNGEFTLSREIINKEVPRFGGGLFIDETPEKLREYIAKGIKIDAPWSTNLMTVFIKKLISLYEQLIKKSYTGYPPYDFSTPEKARHSVRVIGDEEGLTWAQKDLICACIQQESGFNNNAICHNRNKQGIITSSDWGIVQCNDYWHIGMGKTFPSIKYVVDNPDKMVRWMIKMYKVGRLSMWVSYSSGAYKKYLQK